MVILGIPQILSSQSVIPMKIDATFSLIFPMFSVEKEWFAFHEFECFLFSLSCDSFLVRTHVLWVEAADLRWELSFLKKLKWRMVYCILYPPWLENTEYTHPILPEEAEQVGKQGNSHTLPITFSVARKWLSVLDLIQNFFWLW